MFPKQGRGGHVNPLSLPFNTVIIFTNARKEAELYINYSFDTYY